MKHRTTPLAIVLLTLLLTACGVTTLDAEGDLPMVLGYGPTGEDVALDTTVWATFDLAIDLDEAQAAGTFTLSAAGGAVPGTIAHGDDNRHVVFTPDVPLEPDTAYTAELSGALGSITGSVSWNFTTKAAPSGGTDDETRNGDGKGDGDDAGNGSGNDDAGNGNGNEDDEDDGDGTGGDDGSNQPGDGNDGNDGDDGSNQPGDGDDGDDGDFPCEYACDGEPVDVDFSDLTLTKTKFGAGDLSGANFSGSNLSQVVFDGTTLVGTNFSNASLSRVVFRNVDLSGAIFTNANLRQVDFRGSILRGVDLRALHGSSTKIEFDESTDLSGATMRDGTVCAEGSIGSCTPVDEG